MANMTAESETVVRGEIHTETEHRYYSWLAEYLEALEGKEAYREFQERNNGSSKYYTLVASLAA